MASEPLTYAPLNAVTKRDLRQLRLLSTLHYIIGAAVGLLSCIFLIHLALGFTLLTNPSALSRNGQAPPVPFAWLLLLVGCVAPPLGWIGGVAIVYSGRCLKRRTHRTLSLIVAASMCPFLPLGTALGVFTLRVLLRDSVTTLYPPEHLSGAARPVP